MTNSGKRRRQRRNKARQHDQHLEAKAASAEASGISRSAAPTAKTKDCPAQLALERLKMASKVKGEATHYKFCDIATLELQLIKVPEQGIPKVKVIPLAAPRRNEPAHASETAYSDKLKEHDLIVEALSVGKDETTTGGKRQFSEEKEPLKIKAVATDHPNHSGFAPAHPILAIISGGDDDPPLSYGGKEIEADLTLDRTNLLAPLTWGRIWPFGTNDPRNWVVYAQSCGNAPPGKDAVGWLSMLVPVFPFEEWELKLGIAKWRGASVEVEHKHEDGKGSVGVTFKEEHGRTTEQTEVKFTQDSMSRETTTTKQMVLSTFNTGTSTEIEEDEKAGTEMTTIKDIDPKTEAKKITVSWKVGGQETELKVGEFINQMLKFAEIMKDLTKIFGSVKIGWSLGWNYSLLDGSLHLKWGHRWPTSYAETHRVYHVERFVGVGGECKLISVGLEAMAGIDVQTWWGDSIVGKLAAKIDFSFSIGADVDRVWTSASATSFDDDKGGPGLLAKCNTKISLDGKIELTGGGFVFGVGASASAFVTAKFEVTADVGVAWRHGLFGKTSGSVKPVEAKLELKRAGSSASSWTSNPWTIIEHHDLWTDKALFGGSHQSGGASGSW